MGELRNRLGSAALKAVTLRGGFLAGKSALVRDRVLPYQWKALNDEIPGAEPSHAIENFRIAAGVSTGKFGGMVFQDSDVAKWLEAVAYVLSANPDPELEKHADAVIELVEKAQQSDGYLNTYFTLVEPDKKWTNLAECHELYCAGHMIEAAVAYYESTGKDRLLRVVSRLADLVDSKFGPEPGKLKGYPGHQEIELALFKLYRATGTRKYLDLARYFLDERGKSPNYFDIEYEKRGGSSYWPLFRSFGSSYAQAHMPVREQTAAIGHAVRAMYMYCAMADVAAETGDEALADACRALWKNTTRKQMYLTGGIGSSEHGEAFSFDYDLPNDTTYNETCASIGLVFWAHRMLHLELRGEYADIMERALYNGVLSGMSQTGGEFFYVNPLEVWPEACDSRHDKRHVKTSRQKWFGCACCPPNIARLFASIGAYIYSTALDRAVVHLYSNSSLSMDVGGKAVTISQETNYPWSGLVRIAVGCEAAAKFSLGLRVPGWCRKYSIKLNGQRLETRASEGYVLIDRAWGPRDELEIDFDMPVERVYPNPQIREDAGKVAFQRGPLVYCMEEIDNGKNLSSIIVGKDAGLAADFVPALLGGVTVLAGEARRASMEGWQDRLYGSEDPKREAASVRLVPYFAWNNRGVGEMSVWFREG